MCVCVCVYSDMFGGVTQPLKMTRTIVTGQSYTLVCRIFISLHTLSGERREGKKGRLSEGEGGRGEGKIFVHVLYTYIHT